MSNGHTGSSPVRGTMKEETRIQKYWQRVQKTDTCWWWIGTKYPNNAGTFYGCIRWGSNYIPVTHVAWYLVTGMWPKNQINHYCHNPLCINPEHIYDGTQSENMKDMYDAGRQRFRNQKGQCNPNSKLTIKDVKQIRALFAKGLTQTEIAKEYNVSVPNIHFIVRNKTWNGR